MVLIIRGSGTNNGSVAQFREVICLYWGVR